MKIKLNTFEPFLVGFRQGKFMPSTRYLIFIMFFDKDSLSRFDEEAAKILRYLEQFLGDEFKSTDVSTEKELHQR